MGTLRVIFSADQAAASLWDYGEDELVDRARALTDSELDEIWSIAGRYLDPQCVLPVHNQRVVLGHVTALAVITYLEGELRPLARERRRPQKERPEHLRDPQPVPPGTGLTG